MVCRTKSLNPSASSASAAVPEACFSSKASAKESNVGKTQKQLSD